MGGRGEKHTFIGSYILGLALTWGTGKPRRGGGGAVPERHSQYLEAVIRFESSREDRVS